jgi:hypothetical protein
MDGTTATLIGTGVAGFGIATTFVGLVMGQRMARNTQREQWLKDCRKEEFKELLSVLTQSFATICDLYSSSGRSGNDARVAREAAILALSTISDRIYIAKDVKELNIHKIWRDAANEFEHDHVFVAFGEKYALINAMIVDAATKEN